MLCGVNSAENVSEYGEIRHILARQLSYIEVKICVGYAVCVDVVEYGLCAADCDFFIIIRNTFARNVASLE